MRLKPPPARTRWRSIAPGCNSIASELVLLTPASCKWDGGDWRELSRNVRQRRVRAYQRSTPDHRPLWTLTREVRMRGEHEQQAPIAGTDVELHLAGAAHPAGPPRRRHDERGTCSSTRRREAERIPRVIRLRGRPGGPADELKGDAPLESPGQNVRTSGRGVDFDKLGERLKITPVPPRDHGVEVVAAEHRLSPVRRPLTRPTIGIRARDGKVASGRAAGRAGGRALKRLLITVEAAAPCGDAITWTFRKIMQPATVHPGSAGPDR